MAKTLPVTGIVGAVFGALAIAVLVPNSLAMFAPLLVGFVGSGVLIGQRNVVGAVAGIVLLILTVVAALGLVGEVTTEDGGGADFGVSVATGQVLSILVCLAIPVVAVALRWDACEPRWVAIAGVACAAVALLIAATDTDGIAQQNQAETLVAAVLALLAAAPMVLLLRAEAGDAEAGMPAASQAPVAGKPAKAPSAAARPPGRRP